MRHLRFLRGLGRHIDLVNRGRHPIYLDYPVHSLPRYGWGRPRHDALERLLAAGRASYRKILRELESVAERLREIPLSAAEGPFWANGYMGGLDAATLYGFPKLFGARQYLEVGSGSSTKFVRRAIDDLGLAMTITSIDPSPRRHVDDICDDVVRCRLDEAPLSLFDALGPNDILAVDGSHRCFQNSDVTVVFLDILPRLSPGVLVFIHDIFLPDDYPDAWKSRYYSEQYLLAVLLTADAGRRYEVVFPAHFCETDPELAPDTLETWGRIALPGIASGASGFWIRVRDDGGNGRTA